MSIRSDSARRHRALVTLIAALLIGTAALAAEEPATAPAERGDPSARLVGAALVEGRAWPRLAWLSDRIGHRLSGSASLEQAIDWAAETMRADGIPKVWTESVMVPHWVRGDEEAELVAPVRRPIAMLGLGGSVATPPDGMTAAVVVVGDFDELEALGQQVDGRIVLFNKPIEAGLGNPNGYGSAAGLRVHGPSRAAQLGAVAMLIRSLGTADYRLPHTGALRYADDAPKIPAAAISAEDAERIARLAASGDEVRVRLRMSARTLPDAESANVLAEIPGRERPDEIVLIGAHIDSWDVGDGAHDDGSGCVVVMETMRLIHELGVRPRRTIRAVLYTNEENGLRGGKDYAERHGHEHHVAAIETDSGSEGPAGFGVSAGDGATAMLERLTAPLAAIDAGQVFSRGGGADISTLKPFGVPQIGLVQKLERYFDYHHTVADTVDKVDPVALDRNVAALSLLAWRLAEADELLPRLEPQPED